MSGRTNAPRNFILWSWSRYVRQGHWRRHVHKTYSARDPMTTNMKSSQQIDRGTAPLRVEHHITSHLLTCPCRSSPCTVYQTNTTRHSLRTLLWFRLHVQHCLWAVELLLLSHNIMDQPVTCGHHKRHPWPTPSMRGLSCVQAPALASYFTLKPLRVSRHDRGSWKVRE